MNKITTFLKYQFLTRHYMFYIVFPIFIAIYIILRGGEIRILTEQAINTTIAIIGITGGLLLNFLVIILTSNSTLITEYKNIYTDAHFYGKINKGTGKNPNLCPVNLYDFVYYKIFFMIGMSLGFIIVYILYFLDFQSILISGDNYLAKHGIVLPFFVDFAKILYIYAVLLYFLNFGYLVYKLYYLFHKESILAKEVPIIPI